MRSQLTSVHTTPLVARHERGTRLELPALVTSAGVAELGSLTWFAAFAVKEETIAFDAGVAADVGEDEGAFSSHDGSDYTDNART